MGRKIDIKERSINALLKLLMNDNIDKETKVKIRAQLKTEQARYETDACDPVNGVYEGVWETAKAFDTRYNKYFYLAMVQLYREKHPEFYASGVGQHRRIHLKGEMTDSLASELIEKMYEIIAKHSDRHFCEMNIGDSPIKDSEDLNYGNNQRLQEPPVSEQLDGEHGEVV